MAGYVALLNPLVYTFQWVLQPIALFTWFGLSVCTLEVVAATRLCLALRQLRESLHAEYVAKKKSKSNVEIEEKSFIKDLSTTLTVVYGGESMTGQ
jgi:hypothetical protein